MIHLDTSFLIQALRPHSQADATLRGWMKSGEQLAMSTVAWAEFSCGPVDDSALGLAQRVVKMLVPLDGEHARLAAELFNQSGRRRGSLVDCMIAAAAVVEDASLATLDRRDFVRLEALGLKLT